MFSSVRTRLTLWYVGVLTVVLLAFSAAVYVLVGRSLYARLDASLSSTLEIVAAAVAGRSGLKQAGDGTVTKALEELHFPNQWVAVLDAQGQAIVQKPGSETSRFCLPPKPLLPAESPHFYELPESRPDADDSCRGVYRRVRISNASQNASYFVVVTESSEFLSDQLDALQNTLVFTVAISLLLAAFGGWFLARKSLAPMVAMAQTARRITAENLDERLPVVDPRDEIGRLASVFNDLVARLGTSLVQQRQFMADASHQLRTPLSVMQTAAQVTLQKPRCQESEYRDALALVEQQTKRLTRIVEGMFALARADAGHLSLQLGDLYLDELIAELVHVSSVLAAQKGVHIESVITEEALYRGDEGLLRQMILNLLDNAIRYTPEGGVVQVRLERHPAGYVISIADTGPGIPPSAQPHIFERFYRADRLRTGKPGGESGAGLGLSIANVIAELHHGQLTLQRSDPNGSTFMVLLPVT